MEKQTEAIDYIKDIKDRLERDEYDTGSNLEKDFSKSIDIIWKDLKDLERQDLSKLYDVQKFLIDEVCSIHKDEFSKENEELLKNNLNLQSIGHRAEDGKRACGIYYFNDDSWNNFLIGDIHSETISVIRILKKVDFFKSIVNHKKVRLIFLGDYVDRGKAHLKLMHYILSLKYLFPENIMLLRGNHDGGSIKDGQAVMCVGRPENTPDEDWFVHYVHNLSKSNKTLSEEILADCLRFFDSLSNIAFMSYENKHLMLTHGGIPRARKNAEEPYGYIDSIADLTNEEIKDVLDASMISNMMWSDPAIDEDDLREDTRRFSFTKEHFESFSRTLGFHTLVRGHEVQEGGYKLFFDKKLVNIFSSGKIIENNKDINIETAYTRVNPHIVKLDRRGEVSFVDLNS